MTYLDPNDCPWTPEYQMSQPGYKAELAQDMIKNLSNFGLAQDEPWDYELIEALAETITNYYTTKEED